MWWYSRMHCSDAANTAVLHHWHDDDDDDL